MPKVVYIERRFAKHTRALVDQANEIIESFSERGFVLTLRQIYYQFVARDVFPDDRRWRWTGNRWVRDSGGTKNAEPNYKWLGDVINNGRLAGLIDWNAIEDRTRSLEDLTTWGSPAEIARSCEKQYLEDKWAAQGHRIEVWIEKEALAGVFEGPCGKLEVPFFCCRGYPSQSEMWRASLRLLGHEREGQKTTILHFGDHDPSGVDMTRDIIDRLATFTVRPDVKRLALNMDQIEEHKPPPNPAKTTDSRATGYIERFGRKSWELDALSPEVLDELVTDAVKELLDIDTWEHSVYDQEVNREILDDIATNLEES